MVEFLVVVGLLVGVVWFARRAARRGGSRRKPLSTAEPTLQDLMGRDREARQATRHARREGPAPAIDPVSVSTTVPILTGGEPVHIRRSDPPRWVPPGQSVRIQNVIIKGGGFYCGSGAQMPHPPIACLVDPSLNVNFDQPDWRGESLSYYPRYEALSPRARGTFLSFLNSPRDATTVGIGYVFLYYYSIEYRLLADRPNGPDADAQVAALLDEVERLLRIYGPLSNSVRSYMGDLLGLFRPLMTAEGTRIPPPRECGWNWDNATTLALATAVQESKRLEPEAAFQWARILTDEVHSSTWNCVIEEMATLFARRYRERWPQGVVIPPGRSKLKLSYRCASPGLFSASPELDLPDVTRISAPLRPLIAELRMVAAELEPLRRVRRSKNRTPLAELAAVPAELRGSAVPVELRPLATELGSRLADMRFAHVPLDSLLERAGLDKKDKVSKRDATALAQALETLGFGMEPDVRFLGPPPRSGEGAVVFRLPEDAAAAPSPAYAAALLMVQSALLVAGADDVVAPVELTGAVQAIEAHFALPDAERVRLEAHVNLIQQAPPSQRRTENQVKQLSEADRARFAQVLVDIAGADGHISPAEVTLIERFYRALGLDTERVHADLHHASLGQARPATGKVGSAAVLDADAIAAKLAETAQVQAMLGQIFSGADELTSASDQPAASDAPAPQHVSDEAGFDGLDSDHTALLASVLSNPEDTMERADFDAACEALGLLPDGALELLNEVAFTRADEALLEGDDTLYIGAYARETLRPHLLAGAA